MRSRFFILLILCLTLGAVTSLAIPPRRWSRSTGYTRAGCALPGGDFVSTGYIEGTTDFGDTAATAAGQRDVFVSRYDEDGTTLWVRSAGMAGGTTTQNIGRGIAPDGAGGCFVAGEYGEAITFDTTTLPYPGQNVFLARYSQTGSLHWVTSYDGVTRVMGAARDGAGGCYVYGDVQYTSLVLARFDSGGTLQWELAGGDDALAHAVCDDGAGNALIAGSYSGGLTLGDSTLAGNGVFLARVDPAGDVLWLRRCADVFTANDLATDASGAIYMTGLFTSSVAFAGTTLVSNAAFGAGALARFDAAGNFEWARKLEPSLSFGEAWWQNLAVTPDDHIVASAHYYPDAIVAGDTVGGSGGLLVEWDAAGSAVGYLNAGAGTPVNGLYQLSPIAASSGGTLYRWVYSDSLVGYRDIPSAVELARPAAAKAVLLPNHPNPFNPATTVSFRLSADADVDLVIFDVAGNRVRTLASGPRAAGIHHLAWDGTDDRRRAVASGVYFARLRAGTDTAVRKLLLIK